MQSITIQQGGIVKQSRAACVACHTRKIRCDARSHGLPCTNCKNYSRPDCRLHQKKRRRVCDRPVYATAPSNRESSTSPPVPLAPVINGDNVEHSPKDRPAIALATDNNSGNAIGEDDDEDVGRSSTADSPQPIRPRRRPSGLGEYKTHLVEFIDQDNMWQRPIDQEARVSYVGTDVSNLNFLVRHQGGEQSTSVYHYPSNRISRRYLAHEPDRRPIEAFELPEKGLVDDLLQAYFQKINPGFPVVDEELFMAQYRARDPKNPPSLLLLQSILLVGAHASSLPASERETLKTIFFRKAKILFDTRFERNRDTIVQAALLLTWHSDGPEDVAANAWFWTGVASRTALGLGMHRDATPSTLVPHNKRMWKRVWWLLFQADVLLSLQYGRPQAIHLEDCDVQKLSPTDFEGCGASPAIDYTIQMTGLCIILSGVLRQVFGPAVTPSQSRDALRDADAALARWSMLLPDHLRLRPTLTLEFWPTCLQLTYNNALILLHRPRPQSNPSSSFDLTSPNDADICSAAAGVIQSVFEGLRERDNTKYLWVSSVNSLFTAMIQLSVEIRISNPILAISALRRYDSTLHSLRELADSWATAEPVLHFFEKSTKLQQRPDLKAIRDEPTPEVGSAAAMFERGTPTRYSMGSYHPSANGSINHDSPTDVEPAATNAGGGAGGGQDPSSLQALDQAEASGNFPDWRLLFPDVEIRGQHGVFGDEQPPTTSTTDGVRAEAGDGGDGGGGGVGGGIGQNNNAEMMNLLIESRDEWREIYWRNPLDGDGGMEELGLGLWNG